MDALRHLEEYRRCLGTSLEGVLSSDWKHKARLCLNSLASELGLDKPESTSPVAGDDLPQISEAKFLHVLMAMNMLLRAAEIVESGKWQVTRERLSQYANGHVLAHFLDATTNWSVFLEECERECGISAKALTKEAVRPAEIPVPDAPYTSSENFFKPLNVSGGPYGDRILSTPRTPEEIEESAEADPGVAKEVRQRIQDDAESK